MKRWLALSFCLHACLFGTFFLGRWKPFRPEPVEFLRVSLHAAPGRPQQAAPEQETAPSASVVSQEPVPEPAEKPPVEKTPEPAPARTERKPDIAGNGKPATASGPSVRVEGGSFPHAYYLNLIRIRIQENWSPPYRRTGGLESRTAQVGFTIHRDGHVSDAALEARTGFYLFDQAALRAVLNAGRFPPPPGGMTQDHLKIHVTFEALP